MSDIKQEAIPNLKIGRKLGVVLGAIVILITFLIALSTWSLHLVSASMDQAQQQSGRMLLAWRVSSDLADINTQMGNLIISTNLKLDDAQVFSLQKDRAVAFAEMKAAADSDKGKKLVGVLQASMERWKQSNEEMVRLAALGRRDKASEYYQTESLDRYGDAKSAIGDLLEYRREQLEAINTQRNLLLKKIIAALLGIGVFAIAIAVVFGRKLSNSISRPLQDAVLYLTRIAGGDISGEIPDGLIVRSDEIGMLARAIETMSVNLRAMVQEVSGGIDVLSSSSTELLATSSRMMSGSRDSSDKAHLVSAASEEMSSNITSVADGMELATTNLANVVSATEEMTSTIGAIAGNSEKARGITDEAKRQATRITEQISQLGEAAHAIGKITETITAISSQTNLLALNATIEAARAGSAGKGFAVVATEIKALAQQTAAATEDIKARIVGLQSTTSAGISEVGKVSQVIENVSEVVASIAAAIEEQAEATRKIARNIVAATAGVSEANTRISETSIVSREIAKDIDSVDKAAGKMAIGGEQVRTSAADLSSVAEQLKVAIARFRA